MNRKIRIGIPNKGRLRHPCLRTLDGIGLTVLQKEREYISPCKNSKYEIVFARAFDIPIFVENGSIDLGITGYDLVLEREVNVHNLFELNFGKCELVVAGPNDSAIQSINDISGSIRISTEYPKLATKYFQSFGIQTEIFELRGTTELAPKLGLSELIIDITSTGETLRNNGLKIISTILASTSILICNKMSYRSFENEIKDFLMKLSDLIEGDNN